MPIKSNPYINAGIKGFQTSQPFKTSVHSEIPSVGSDVIFPTLAKLNAELFDWNENEEEMVFVDDSLCVDIEVFAAAPTPHPSIQAPISPSVPEIGPLKASILASDDKLFFIYHFVLDLPWRNVHWPVLVFNNHSRRILQLFRVVDFLLIFTLSILQTGTTTQSISATSSSIIQTCMSLILVANVSPI